MTITQDDAHEMARYTLFSFLVTFILSRACVFLIMSGEIPNLYFFMHGVHVHHLNYGIFLLAAVGGFSVFRRPENLEARITALIYGVAMGLTFDEFGMWLHLGGSYWQRASIDGVVVVGALLALIAFSTTIEKLEARHFLAFIILAVMLVGFGAVIYIAGNHIGGLVGPRLVSLEEASSP